MEWLQLGKTINKKSILIVITVLTLGLALCGPFFIFFSPGDDNSICFDVEKQSVIKCKGTISSLSLISEDNEDILYFKVISHRKRKSSFSLKEIDKDYSIHVTSTLIDLGDFKLRPLMEYEIISHSNGDRASDIVTIRTDIDGKVIYTDKALCE
jgi:hypothetical protein